MPELNRYAKHFLKVSERFLRMQPDKPVRPATFNLIRNGSI
jgi:hypothetical protein